MVGPVPRTKLYLSPLSRRSTVKLGIYPYIAPLPGPAQWLIHPLGDYQDMITEEAFGIGFMTSLPPPLTLTFRWTTMAEWGCLIYEAVELAVPTNTRIPVMMIRLFIATPATASCSRRVRTGHRAAVASCTVGVVCYIRARAAKPVATALAKRERLPTHSDRALVDLGLAMYAASSSDSS